MKILKYILLLLLLSFVSLCVFVTTQKGVFSLEKSKLIHVPKTDLYHYVNDYRNWEDFISYMVEDTEIKLHFSKNTSGIGSFCSWEGKKGKGMVQTIANKENNSISQKMNYDGTSYDILWLFKDTLGGTKVVWKSKGKMNFEYKVQNFLYDEANTVIGKMIEKSLTNLNTILDYEMNTFSIRANGVVQKLGTNYLKQSFTTKITTIVKNTRIVFTKIIAFCKRNDIERNGKPFVIYHTYDIQNGIAKISCCVPIKEPIMTSEGSDILSGKLIPFRAVKTTLNGDYSHIKKALDSCKSYLNNHKFISDTPFSHLEIYTISRTEIKNPSKWKTEIYYPIKPKRIIPKNNPVTEEIPSVEPEMNATEL